MPVSGSEEQDRTGRLSRHRPTPRSAARELPNSAVTIAMDVRTCAHANAVEHKFDEPGALSADGEGTSNNRQARAAAKGGAVVPGRLYCGSALDRALLCLQNRQVPIPTTSNPG